MKSALKTIVALVAFAASAAACAQQGDGTQVSTKISVFKPDKVEPTSERIAQLRLPSGFRANAFATG